MQGVWEAAFRGCFFVPLLVGGLPILFLLERSQKQNGTQLYGRKFTFLPLFIRSLNHGGEIFIISNKIITYIFVGNKIITYLCSVIKKQ